MYVRYIYVCGVYIYTHMYNYLFWTLTFHDKTEDLKGEKALSSPHLYMIW